MNEKALIIFAKQPVPGKVKTRMVPRLSARQAAELHKFMLTDIINRTASLEDLDRFLFYSGGETAEVFFHEQFPSLRLFPQEGGDLGSRMEEAFSRLFALGYRAAAIIGSDSPDLPLSHIDAAFRLLETGTADAVFGPAEDGGYYLLAMKRVHKELFHGISWGSGAVLRESLEKAASMGLRVTALPLWHDVDTFEDLARLDKGEKGNRAHLTLRFIELLEPPVGR